ncbi:MAG TPA: ABC transporter ATP-binding protein [bacterium]|jgi:subfamily B ATP-binding cassette protein MsbA
MSVIPHPPRSGAWQAVLRFVAPYWAFVAGGVCCLLAIVALELFVPRYLGVTIDTIIRTRSLQTLNTAALVFLAVYGLRSLLLYGQISFSFLISHRVIADIRQDLFERVQRWSLDRFARFSSGDLIARSLHDTQVVQTTLLIGALDFLATSLLLLGIVVMLFVVQWRLAIQLLIVIPVLLSAARLFGREIQRISHRAQERIADLASLLRQTFGGARVIRAFVQEYREIGRFRRENERALRDQLRISQLVAAQVPLISFLTALGLVTMLWQGGRLVTNGTITAGALVSFLIYASLAIEPSVSLSRLYSATRQGLGALERVVELMRVSAGVADDPHAADLPQIAGRVAFEHVSFAYAENRWALRDLTLEVEPGERIAVVGPSGAGKTTLINLLPRFYDPARGRVTIDGHDLRAVRLRTLRRQIGLVPQETILFDGTARENIAYARPEAPDEDVIAAAVAANAHEFIVQLPEGYDTPLGEDGFALSGGQRQRLAIARAILNRPRIIILDEATSALDSESEALVQEALDRLMEGRTTFIIAHRLSTIRRSDRIVVLDRGGIVEAGRHEQLLGAGGLYARLAHRQFEPTGSGIGD